MAAQLYTEAATHHRRHMTVLKPRQTCRIVLVVLLVDWTLAVRTQEAVVDGRLSDWSKHGEADLPISGFPTTLQYHSGTPAAHHQVRHPRTSLEDLDMLSSRCPIQNCRYSSGRSMLNYPTTSTCNSSILCILPAHE